MSRIDNPTHSSRQPTSGLLFAALSVPDALPATTIGISCCHRQLSSSARPSNQYSALRPNKDTADSPLRDFGMPGACNSKIEFSEVNAIIQERCVSCHSSKPTDDVYKAPPNGVMYDTPEDIVRKKDLIMQRVVVTKTMPQNNKTNITQKERDILRSGIEQGASVK